MLSLPTSRSAGHIVTLDLETVGVNLATVPLDEVLAVLRGKRPMLHVVVTGRNAHQELIDMADLVTEMTKVKHPMDAGQKGQKGIEW